MNIFPFKDQNYSVQNYTEQLDLLIDHQLGRSIVYHKVWLYIQLRGCLVEPGWLSYFYLKISFIWEYGSAGVANCESPT